MPQAALFQVTELIMIRKMFSLGFRGKPSQYHPSRLVLTSTSGPRQRPCLGSCAHSPRGGGAAPGAWAAAAAATPGPLAGPAAAGLSAPLSPTVSRWSPGPSGHGDTHAHAETYPSSARAVDTLNGLYPSHVLHAAADKANVATYDDPVLMAQCHWEVNVIGSKVVPTTGASPRPIALPRVIPAQELPPPARGCDGECGLRNMPSRACMH